MSLADLTLANSNSKILQLLSKPAVTEFVQKVTTERKMHQRKTFEQRIQSMTYKPALNPHSIVLEMDKLDKDKLEIERKSEATKFVKNQDKDELLVSERIEMVRRELVLKGMGKEVPTFPNGTINI